MSEISKLNGYDLKDKKAIRTYDTVASMIADETIKEGQHIKTRGYYEINDGGSAEYIIVDDNTLIDDGGSIHELTNGLFAKLISNVVNVKQFGAVGDNITDDTNSFNSAINYMKDNDICNIYIPNGIYLISDTLNFVQLNKTFNIYGESRQNTVLKCISNVDEFIKLSEGTNESDRVNFKYYIHDLTIDGDNYADIVVNSFLASYSTLERVKIVGQKEDSILLKISCWVNRILNCTIRGYDGYTDEQGFSYRKLTGIEISKFLTLNNIIIQNNDFAFLRRAINCTQDINQVDISGNSFDECGKIIVTSFRINDLHIHDNYFEAIGGNRNTLYTLDPVEYVYNTFSKDVNACMIFYDSNPVNTSQTKNSVVIDNNIFANCRYEHLVGISNPLNFIFKDNTIYGFNYLTNTPLYNKIILYFGVGGMKFSNMQVDWYYPIETLIDYDINTGSYLYDYSIKKINIMSDNITSKRGIAKAQYNSSDIDDSVEIKVDTTKNLLCYLNLSNIDLNNLNPIIAKCENGTYKITIQRYNESNNTWTNVDVDRNWSVTDNTLYIPLQRFKSSITSNKLRLNIFATSELVIDDIVYIPSNSYQDAISLI